ncbi:MAG TPA: MAPEG family protein [Acidocella sp.]|nr:MAPEG family protein [Acidocella sp.]
MAKFHGLLLVSAVLGLIFMLLSGNVARQRFLTRVMIGDGDGQTGAETLRKAVRAQANFAEYVPLILFLLAGDAFAGASAKWVVWPGIALVLARLSHAAGMYRPAPNPLRAGGAMLTWAVLILASLEALYLTF